MAFKKSANSAGPKVWSVAELGAFYTENRAELLTHANRVLKDSAKAEEITLSPVELASCKVDFATIESSRFEYKSNAQTPN